MFNTLETIITASKLSCNKLLLLSLIINISPLSYELEPPSEAKTTPTTSSSSATQSSSTAPDNLIVKVKYTLTYIFVSICNFFFSLQNYT